MRFWEMGMEAAHCKEIRSWLHYVWLDELASEIETFAGASADGKALQFR